jgi:F-type H+-transporting ATPase subunit a
MAAGLPHPVFVFEELLKIVGLTRVDEAGHVVSLIPIHVLYAWVAMILLISLGWLATRKISLVPKGAQNFLRGAHRRNRGLRRPEHGRVGPEGFPRAGHALSVHPREQPLRPDPRHGRPDRKREHHVIMAVFVFIYYQYWGFKLHGSHYIKHFMGPVWWLAPLMLIIEVIGHFARILSLTLRLFGNIKGEEIVLLLLFILAPVVSTIPITLLFLLMKSMQAFIFFMLSLMYLKGAFEEAH